MKSESKEGFTNKTSSNEPDSLRGWKALRVERVQDVIRER